MSVTTQPLAPPARDRALTLSRRLSILTLAGLTALAGCAGRQTVRRYDREQLQASLKADTDPGLVLGDFPLLKVIDGDTVKVAGLENTLRLYALDTEETFKKEKERRAYEMGWSRYLADAESKTKSPVKIATPLGEDAKHFAVDWFKGVRTVHLERDHPKEIRGRFNRFLTYVFADKGGTSINYNVECVRAGMSPYFTKYGYSRRFHQDFVDAQDQARAAGLGIWSPGGEHYTDYEARLVWWNARADAIAKFEKESEGRKEYIALTNFDSLDRLQEYLGREVVLFGAIADIRMSEKGPIKVLLGRRLFSDFPLIFFDHQVFDETRVAESKGEYIRVRGVVTAWYNKYKKRDELQIEVKLPGQIERAPVMRPIRGQPFPVDEPPNDGVAPDDDGEVDDPPEGVDPTPPTADDEAAPPPEPAASSPLAVLRRRPAPRLVASAPARSSTAAARLDQEPLQP
ncbi:MAG: thermonuclease family protein [Nannocystaceae bacterium]